MSEADSKPEDIEWRVRIARAREIWREEVGGTNASLFAKVRHAASFAETSLSQNVRPNGRRPRHHAKILAAIANAIAIELHARRSDLTIEQFELKLRQHIEGGDPSPLIAPVSSPAISSAVPSRLQNKSAFDLWTPGQSDNAIVNRFANELGADGVEKIKSLSRAAIDAIGRGDFAAQKAIAEEAVLLGKSAPKTPLLGEGLYLEGEATRLLADIEPDRDAARRLRREAESLYEKSEEELGGDPRPIRGRARTVEVLGDLDSALKLFRRAEATVDLRSTDLNDENCLSLQHERVRSLRHRITCLAAMHLDAPSSALSAQSRAEELRLHLLKSEQLHESTLDNFKPHKEWWLIEWFMAQVLHAKGWVALGETSIAAKRLIWALECRLQMMPDDGQLNSIEIGNLHWWANTIGGARFGLEGSQDRAFGAFKGALDRGEDRRVIKMLGKDFLRAGAPPWSK